MGGTSGTISKRKSSSSKKKKRSHNLSQVRKRKRSRSRSRRDKSKKLRRRDDSIVYSDNDDSKSSASISSSSSEDDHRRRRSRSRTRRDVKKTKKSTRKNSSSSESGRDARRIKKRKGSKRNVDVDTRKKSRGKKPKTRDVSISSTSSGSRSCSTCRGDSGNSSGEKRVYEKRRGRSERKEIGKRDVGKRGIKRSRHRSRSSSSCSRSSKGSGYQREEKLVSENNSIRLRSVITVAKEPEENEERELDKDGHKEEIIYDHDEYPSCRSNDSNDGGINREVSNNSHVVTSQNKKDEKVKGKRGIVSSVRTTEYAVTGIDEEDRYDGSYLSFDVVEENNQFRETNIGDSAAIGSPDNVDLESILRQRALENLKKFRGGLQIKTTADEEEKNDDHVKQSSMVKTDFLPHKEVGARVQSATDMVDQINGTTTTKVAARSSQNDKNIQVGGYSKTRPEASKLVQTKSFKEDNQRLGITNKAVDQISMSRVRRNSNPTLQDERKLQDDYYDGTYSRAGRQDVNRPPRLVMTGHSKVSESTSADAIDNKSKPATSALRQEPIATCSSLKQGPTSEASPKDKQLVSKGDVNNSPAETAKTLPNSTNSNGVQVNDASGSAALDPSCLEPASEDQSSKELQGEAKEGSQYEQKTMSVMRGGEMVQVSYKVYIPKKTPALARRQLRR